MFSDWTRLPKELNYYQTAASLSSEKSTTRTTGKLAAKRKAKTDDKKNKSAKIKKEPTSYMDLDTLAKVKPRF